MHGEGLGSKEVLRDWDYRTGRGLVPINTACHLKIAKKIAQRPPVEVSYLGLNSSNQRHLSRYKHEMPDRVSHGIQ